jgi:NADH-quinone oxidoreductase subunit C
LDESLKDLNEFLLSNCSEDIISSVIEYNHLTITIVFSSLEKITSLMKINNVCQFRTLIDITAIDYPEQEERFCLVYHYLSMQQNIRIRIKSFVKDEQIVPSITNLFPSANWFEREVFDMYGILFSNHPDMRRILTDYGFQGHPLRKDFPLTGFDEVSYETESRRVVYNKVKLTQDYRDFDFNSPWGAETSIKDEKNND